MTEVVEYPSNSWKGEQLQEALKSKDVLLKMGAIRVLQEEPNDEYIATLVDTLNDSDRLVRINAAITLGRAKSPLAVPALVYHAVADQDKDVRSYASWAYRQLDYQKASPYLVKVLLESDNHDMIRFAAGEIRQKNDLKAVDTLIQRFQSKGMYTGYDPDMAAVNGLYEIGYATVEPLLKCLDSEDTRVQANAAYTLGKIGDDRAIQPLINHLAKADLEMRSRISDALIKIGRASIPALIRLLDNKDSELKWIAAYSLAQIGPDAEVALLKNLKMRGPAASEEIVYALGIAGRKDSFSPLYETYISTPDDSVKAWSSISLANIAASSYYEVTDRASANKFLDELGDQLKPHMLLSYDTLYALGKIYIDRAATTDVVAFKSNMETGVKCFDLSIIERDNAAARAFRLFYGSYLKLMASKSPDIMNYIERDITDLKKEAERSSNKKEILFLMDKLLKILQGAYEDRGFDFTGNFREYAGYCKQMEPFLDDFYHAEDPKKPMGKEQPTLHADVGMIQDKIDALLKSFEKSDDAESIALAYRLSTEVARIDTGIYDDYRIAESCLKGIVSRMAIPNEEKSDLYFKILLISKNGVSQIQLVLDRMLKGANVAPVAKKSAGVAKADVKKPGMLEYIAIAIIIILIVAIIVIALHKFNIVPLPFRLPVSWLNPSLADALLGSGLI
ncbi:HEAT repeat domain-containing protein [Methanocella paludicola]|uniref:HEAT repeat domain-containing protein n=1 Tax=Methanocella paludicola TaxID=570267 RepID=UPI001E5FADE3|nr:HEAT repeat domain-containing protein [Methanocella paludicola]